MNTGIIDSLMQETIHRNLLKYAAGRAIFCPHCDTILDCRSTVVATRDTREYVMCARCWDSKVDQAGKAACSEIVDGRELWPAPAKRTYKPRTSKHTFKARLDAGLQASGWQRDWSDKSRYNAWIKPGEAYKLFVGPSGALRKGECASRSYSIGDPSNQRDRYADLLRAGDAALAAN